MVDVVCGGLPPPGGRVHADVSLRAGGSAVNAAIAASGAGACASVVGRIGGDPAGDLLLVELERLGIEARLARSRELPTGVAVALAGDPGAASVVANRGANAGLSPEDVPPVLDADALFVSGFALFQSGSAEAARAAIERFTGTFAGVDVGSPQLAAGVVRSGLADAGGRRIVLLANADEARAMTGAEPEEAARLLAPDFSIVCVKLGEAGAVAAAGAVVERCAAEPVAPRSPFGAGDAFGAVFLVALAAGDPLGTALARACEAGARAVGAVDSSAPRSS